MTVEYVLMVRTNGAPKMPTPEDNRKQSKEHSTLALASPVTSSYFLTFYKKQKGGMLVNQEPPTFQNQVLPDPPPQLQWLRVSGLFTIAANVTHFHCSNGCVLSLCACSVPHIKPTTAYCVSFQFWLRGSLLHITPPPHKSLAWDLLHSIILWYSLTFWWPQNNDSQVLMPAA